MDFDTAFDRTLGNEGGYINNPSDPGGETNWGISKRAYPNVNIKELTKEAAKKIYFEDFWDPLMQEGGLEPVMYQMFDFAVNSGIQTAIRTLQRAIGVADDGYWGPVSRNRAKGMTGIDLAVRLNAERLDYMTRLSDWHTFSVGWARRIVSDLRYAVQDSEEIK